MTLFNQHKKRTKHLGSYDEELVKTKLTEIMVTENVEQLRMNKSKSPMPLSKNGEIIQKIELATNLPFMPDSNKKFVVWKNK